MKSLLVHSVWIVSAFLLLDCPAAYADVDIKIKGQQAKSIYKTMTAIQEDGAAGHFYKQGKSVLCSYTNADMSDSNGKNIPRGDIRRYACSVHFNRFGHATPSKHP